MTTQSLSAQSPSSGSRQAWAVAPTDGATDRTTERAVGGVRGRVVPTVAVGVGATLISLAGVWTPSYWGDEAASVMSAERSLPSLFAMLVNVDAVHGLYYLFLHFWIGAFGMSELATRIPSALAVGIAAVGVLTLVRRFTSLRLALMAAVAFVLLPRVVYAGGDARSYAMGAAAAVWLAVWFTRLLFARRSRLLEWIGFGAAVGASAYLFLYLLLLAPVFAIVLVATREGRGHLRTALLAGVATLVVAAPMLWVAVHQRGQIAFLARRDYANPYSILVAQWFGWIPLAVVAWLLIIVALASVRRFTPRQRTGVLLLALWFGVPTLALLVGNALISPMYNVRYLTFSAPAAAMLMVVGASALPDLLQRMRRAGSTRRAARGLPAGRGTVRTSSLTLAALGLVAILAIPACIAERGPFAKDNGSDLRQSAAVVASIAQPGDAVIFDSSTRPSQRPRLAYRLYPKDFVGLDDVGLRVPFTQRAGLWDVVAPVSALTLQLADHSRVLAVELRGTASADLQALKAQGFAIDAVQHVHRTDVYTLTRKIS